MAGYLAVYFLTGGRIPEAGNLSRHFRQSPVDEGPFPGTVTRGGRQGWGVVRLPAPEGLAPLLDFQSTDRQS